MSGVNDYDPYESVVQQIESARKDCWHSVSNPPNECDGDPKGLVLHWWFETQGGVWVVTTTDWRHIHSEDHFDAELGHKWARIHDVVLLPSDQ